MNKGYASFSSLVTEIEDFIANHTTQSTHSKQDGNKIESELREGSVYSMSLYIRGHGFESDLCP